MSWLETELHANSRASLPPARPPLQIALKIRELSGLVTEAYSSADLRARAGGGDASHEPAGPDLDSPAGLRKATLTP